MRIRPGLIGSVMLVTLLALALAASLAPALGFKLDVVRSGSMSPTIGAGDLVVTTPTSPEELKVGDVACFQVADGLRVCHRIIAVDTANSTFTTKGDANEDVDPSPVAYENILGRVALSIPMVGHVVCFMQGPLGLMVILMSGVALLLMGGIERTSDDGEVQGPKGGWT